MIFLCYPKCTTCQKAQKWLTPKGFHTHPATSRSKTQPWPNSGSGIKKAAFH